MKSHDTNKIHIIVREEKKHYVVSRSLLCCYSTVLDAMRLPGTSIIELPDDKIGDWEILYEFIIRGGFHDGLLDFKGSGKEIVGQCVELLKYAAKYNMHAIACELIYGPMKTVFKNSTRSDGSVTDLYIRTVFQYCPENSPLRALITQAAIKLDSAEKFKGTFSRQESEVQGFANETLKQFRVVLQSKGYLWGDIIR
jgi:hypothetical protein